MLTPEQMALIVVGAQLPLLALAFVIEFSARKARRVAREDRVEAAPAAIQETEPKTTAPAPSGVLSEETSPIPAEPPTAVNQQPQPEPPAEIIEPETNFDSVGVSISQATIEASSEEEPIAGPVTMGPVTMGPVPAAPAPAPARIGLGLRRTRDNFLARMRAAITGSSKLDEICEGLEEALIAADVGVETSLKIVQGVRDRLKNNARPDIIRDALKEEIEQTLRAVEPPALRVKSAPMVIMLAGVNGVGKTTTVAKLAARLKLELGAPIVVAASDTFRAAAIEQLQIWCDRVGADLIKQKQGSDPAAVAFDAVKAAVARNASTVLIDTAGRLQTKVNLMEELKKIARVVAREVPGAPHETWLVLDATTGQNALSQAKLFNDAAPVSGVILAKLDSTAKGGVIIAIAEQLKLPVLFVGLGEDVTDLEPFDSHEFVNALFSDADSGSEAVSSTYAA